MTTFNDWLDADTELTTEHRAFLDVWFLRASEWENLEVEAIQLDPMTSANILLLIFGISDNIRHKVLRDLRVEFNGYEVRCGEDKLNWLEGFNEQEPVESFVGAPLECVNFVLQWLQREWFRPVDLHEWNGENPNWRHTQYIMPNSGRYLSWSGWKNVPEGNLGPPHRVTRVHPLSIDESF